MNLKIGDKITVSAISRTDYDEHGQKVVYKFIVDRLDCYVCGIKRKALGKYIKAYPGDQWDDYQQAELKVSSYVKFYECRERIDGRTFLVHPDDIR